MDIFTIKNYRQILQEALAKAKENGTHTLTTLSAELSVHPTFLSQVLKGRKELSVDQAYQAGQSFGFTLLELEYFLLVLQENRAGHHETKAYFETKMKTLRTEKLKLGRRLEGHKQLTDEEKAVFYSTWINSVIRLYTSFENGMSTDEIATKLRLSREKVFEHLSFLCRLGLCQVKGELYFIGEQHIHVPANSPHVVRHHINWRLQGMRNLDQAKPEELHFTGPMAISKEDFAWIREQLVKSIQEVIERAKQSKAQDVACLNIDFFWPIKK